jgi:hypothetical protein
MVIRTTSQHGHGPSRRDRTSHSRPLPHAGPSTVRRVADLKRTLLIERETNHRGTFHSVCDLIAKICASTAETTAPTRRLGGPVGPQQRVAWALNSRY